MSAVEELFRVASGVENPYLEAWKAQGKRVVGFLCSHVPEEILYAAELLPYRMRAPGCVDTAAADVYMGHVNCTFVRACLEYVFDDRFAFLDGLVFTNSCDHSRRLYDILREKKPFTLMHFLSVPHKVGGDEIAQWHRSEFAALKEGIEETFGAEVTQAGLRRAIRVYNESRALLRELYDLRRRARPPLTGAETLSIVLAASSVPREEFNRMLREALRELREREGVSGRRARLMLAGSGGCDDPEFYRVIEDQGGLIVTDSLCFGSRYFWNDVEDHEDPILALARSYLRRPACANMTDQVAERFEFIERMTRDFEVDGVIFQRIRHCDLWGGQLLYMTERMRQSGIPLLSLEREYRLGAIGQLRTRVQAFLESME